MYLGSDPGDTSGETKTKSASRLRLHRKRVSPESDPGDTSDTYKAAGDKIGRNFRSAHGQNLPRNCAKNPTAPLRKIAQF